MRLPQDWISSSHTAADERGVNNVTFEKDNTFDIVHEHQVLLHLTGPIQAVKEMRRVVKPDGIVAIRDNQYRTHFPSSPFLLKMQQQYADFMTAAGLDPNLGARLHICAHEAGFGWENIEMSSWGWELSGQGGRQARAHQAANSLELFMKTRGDASETELEEVRNAYEAWSCLPEARFMALDTALICRK
ncbi:hypothetical protein LTR86_004387 [Recurvomyces mirabilis]|nr:hypothetical protein LTR86_004387 [Recurvomyces mirabilis]